MEYALLIYENQGLYGPGNDENIREIVGRHMKFSKDLGPNGLAARG